MIYLYAIMDIDHSEFVKGFFNGRGAHYNDDKLVLVGLTEEQISTFDGEIIRVDEAELNNGQLTSEFNRLSARSPRRRLIIMDKPQGKFLHKGHRAFKQVTEI